MRGRTSRERLFLVGTGPQAIALARELYERRVELSVDIIGFIDADAGKRDEHVVDRVGASPRSRLL